MPYSRKQPRKPIYDAESGVPPTETQMVRMRRQADNVAKYWVEQRRMTVQEMREKLEKKKLVSEIVDEKLAKLVKEGLLNDVGFAEDFVYFKQEFMSERKMRETMLRKGVDVAIVDEALLEVSEEEQRAGALRVASRRARATRKEQNPYKRRAKIMSSVIGKGYTSEIAGEATQAAIDEIPVEEPPAEEVGSEEEQAETLWQDAYRLAESKVRATRSKADLKKRKQSIIQSLLRKGYSFDIAREAAETALSAEHES